MSYKQETVTNVKVAFLFNKTNFYERQYWFGACWQSQPPQQRPTRCHASRPSLVHVLVDLHELLFLAAVQAEGQFPLQLLLE